MKIIDRFCLLVRADAHGILDQLEERALLIKQHLREAELALEEKRTRVEAIDERLRHLDVEAEHSQLAIESFDRDIALALEQEEEALARFTIRQLIPERARLADAQARTAELTASRARLADALRGQEAAFDALRSRAAARLAELEREDEEVPCASRVAVEDEEVELELLRRRTSAQRVDPNPAEHLR